MAGPAGGGERTLVRSFFRADLAGFLVGFFSLGIQILLLRRLLAAFSGNELTLGLAFSVWTAATSLGAYLFGRPFFRRINPEQWLGTAFFLCSFLLIPAVIFPVKIKEWFGLIPGETAGPPLILAACFLSMTLICCLLGSAFNCAVQMQKAGPAAARTYRFEALGSCGSGLALAWWFAGTAEPLLPALVGAGFLAIAGAAFRLRPAGSNSRRWFWAVLACLLVTAGAAPVFLPALRQKTADRFFWPGRTVLASFDSRYGYLAALQDHGQVTIFSDGVPAASFPAPATAELLVHLPLAMCPTPRRVLLLGGGLSALAEEILKHPVDRLDYLELDPAVLELEKKLVPGFRKAATDPRVRIHLADGRPWLRKFRAEYDAVILNLPDPFTAGLNRFYTAEFFTEVKAVLRPAGVFAITAGISPPNRAYTAGQLGLLAGTVKTLRAVFPALVILPLDFNLLVAGDQNSLLSADPGRLQQTLAARGIKTFYASPDLIASDLAPQLLDDLNQKLQAAAAEVDQDLHPRGYLYSLLLWAEQTSPATQKLLRRAVAVPAWWFAGLPVLVLALGALGGRRGSAGGLAGLAAGIAGFSGIVTELAALVAFQMLAGSVYFALTFLTAAFMVGLAGGAFVWERLRDRLDPAWTMTGFAAWGGLSLAGITGMMAWSAGGAVVVMGFSGLLFGLGAVTGAVFSAAAGGMMPRREEIGGGAGTVYAAELLGSALGGLLAGAVLIPRLGILGAMVCAFFTAASGVVILHFRRPAKGG